MFDALKGLKEALAAKERLPEERKILATDAIEELNSILSELELGTIVTVIYYCDFGQCYNQLTGKVKKIDTFWHYIQLGESCINFDDIFDILLS